MTQRLKDLVGGIADFDKWAHADKLRFFSWVLHGESKEHLKASDFVVCYDALHLRQPVNLRRSMESLEEQGDLLKSASGHRLEKTVRDRLEAKYGMRTISVQVHSLLASLPGRLSAPEQQDYLDEAIRCFRAEAWRGAALMSWNLAFDHLVQVIVTTRLADFNAAYAKQYQKKPLTFSDRADFQEVKESVVIDIARAAGITDKTQHQVLDRNLGVRNSIAHPSAFPFKQPQSEAFILEVVQTVVLGLTI